MSEPIKFFLIVQLLLILGNERNIFCFYIIDPETRTKVTLYALEILGDNILGTIAVKTMEQENKMFYL